MKARQPQLDWNMYLVHSIYLDNMIAGQHIRIGNTPRLCAQSDQTLNEIT